LGKALPHKRLLGFAEENTPAQRRFHVFDSLRPVERKGGSEQQQNQTYRKNGIRIREHRQLDRLGHVAMLKHPSFPAGRGTMFPHILMKPPFLDDYSIRAWSTGRGRLCVNWTVIFLNFGLMNGEMA
jgi:hypothetical protein